jgi:LemA protein
MEWMIALAPVAALGGAGFVGMTAFNRLMALDSRCDKANADIDVQLRHRHSLIPNLLELLKGYMGHELETIAAVGRTRQSAIQAPTPEARAQAEALLGKQLNKVMLTAEQLPSLQANEHFRALRSELTDAENKIAAARRFLNMAVDEFNATSRQFPANLFASRFKIGKRSFYDLGYDRALVEEGPSIKF